MVISPGPATFEFWQVAVTGPWVQPLVRPVLWIV
jgi:hypothetical protein